MAIEWSEEISVGDATLDAQHRKLFEQSVKLYQAVLDGKGRELIGETVEYLHEYITEHFSYEEDYMRAHGYPQADQHTEIHAEFVRQFHEMEHGLIKGNDEAMAETLKSHLVNWWVTHINTVDRHFMDYIQKNSKSHPSDESDDYHETIHK